MDDIVTALAAAASDAPPADAPAEGAPPTEQAPSGEGAKQQGEKPEQQPDAEKTNALLTALKKKQDWLARRERKFETARAELEAQSKALQDRIAQGEKASTILERLRAADPTALDELGVDWQALLDGKLKSGSVEARLDRFERERAEREKAEQEARRRAEQEASQQAHTQQVRGALDKFVKFVRADENAYGDVAIYEDADIGQAAYGLAEELAAARGRPPSLTELAAEMQRRLAAKHERIVTKRKPPAPPATQAPTAQAAPSGLSNRDVATRAETQRELTEAEREADATRKLAQIFGFQT